MSDTTPAPAAEVTPAPLVAPDLSKATLDTAVAEVSTAAAPFLPANVRAAIYTVGGLVIVVAGAVAPVIGGTIGDILDVAASAVGALVGAVAVSHVNK